MTPATRRMSPDGLENQGPILSGGMRAPLFAYLTLSLSRRTSWCACAHWSGRWRIRDRVARIRTSDRAPREREAVGAADASVRWSDASAACPASSGGPTSTSAGPDRRRAGWGVRRRPDPRPFASGPCAGNRDRTAGAPLHREEERLPHLSRGRGDQPDAAVLRGKARARARRHDPLVARGGAEPEAARLRRALRLPGEGRRTLSRRERAVVAPLMAWMAPASGIAMGDDGCSRHRQRRERCMDGIATPGVDPATCVFPLHGVDAVVRTRLRCQVRRSRMASSSCACRPG
jgi:hypothetical protein